MASTEVLSGELVRAGPTLTELAIELNREHHLVGEALSHAMTHAVRAGEILNQAREQIGQSGQWIKWLSENFDGSRDLAQYYLRIYEYQDLVKGCPSVFQAMKRLKGMPAIRLSSGVTGKNRRHSEETKEEVRKLFSNGMARREISELTGIPEKTIGTWVDPEVFRRYKERNRAYQRKLRQEQKQKREEAKQRAAERDASRVGGSLAESYSLIHKLEKPLALASRNAGDPEIERLLNSAIYHQHKALDAIVEALGRS
jgi:hypothetical protein